MSHPRRVFLELADCSMSLESGTSISLPSAEAHHLRNVLRLPSGSQITIISRQSEKEYLAELTSSVEPSKIIIIKELTSTQHPSSVKTIMFALSKGKKNDLVCEKAAELGLQNIIFWMSHNSVTQIVDEAARQKKIQRWRAIAESAVKQSERSKIPAISCLTSLDELLDFLPTVSKTGDSLLCCSLSAEAIPASRITCHSGIHILVGPEGGLTQEEENRLAEHDFSMISLGVHKLRSETAAIYAIAALQTLKYTD